MPPNTTPTPGAATATGPYTAESGQLVARKAPTWWNPAWTTPSYWKSWSWLAALAAFIPVILPDLLNWVIAHFDLIELLVPTLAPDTKALLLKIAVGLVIVLRPLKQSNMPADVTPVAVVKVPAQLPIQVDDKGIFVNTVIDTIDVGDAASAFSRHARDFLGPAVDETRP